MKRPILLTLAVALALAGCSGSNSSSSQAQSAAGQATAAAGDNAVAASDLPVYPGAAKTPFQMTHAITFCGHKVSMSLYEVKGADFDTVSNWYDAHISNAVKVTKSDDLGGGSGSHMVEMFEPSGSGAAFVTQTHFAPAMDAMMKGRGGHSVHVGLTVYDPAFSPDEIHLMQDATGTDASAKQQAMAQLKAKCGNDLPTGAGQ